MLRREPSLLVGAFVLPQTRFELFTIAPKLSSHISDNLFGLLGARAAWASYRNDVF